MNIFLYSLLGAGTIAPIIMLAIAVLIVIASIALNDRLEPADKEPATSRQKVPLDPTLWGAYEKSMLDESIQETECIGQCVLKWRPKNTRTYQ
jgi:hypothetical protein